METFDGQDHQLVQPVSVLLLDINMPVLNGLDTTTLLKQKIAEANEGQSLESYLRKERGKHTKPFIVRPLICYLTQFDTNFSQFIKDHEQVEVYL